MSVRNTCRATLLAAVNRVKDLASYVISQPFDFAAQSHLVEGARIILDCGETLGNQDLSELGKRLVRIAQNDVSSASGVRELDATIARISTIAEKLNESDDDDDTTEDDDNDTNPTNPFDSLTGLRWLVL